MFLLKLKSLSQRTTFICRLEPDLKAHSILKANLVPTENWKQVFTFYAGEAIIRKLDW